MLTVLLKGGLLLAGVSGVALAAGPIGRNVELVAQSLPGQYPRPLAPAPAPLSVAPVRQLSVLPADPIAAPIAEWRRLQQSDAYPFGDYARFLLAHPGWPGETGRRAAAETRLDGTADPALVNRYFERFPPVTAAGRVRQAEALAAFGRSDAAREAARAAWRAGALRPADESMLLSRFPGAIAPNDHDARMDRLLWQGGMAAAARQIAWVSPGRRATFAARLAFRTAAPDAGVVGEAPGVDRNDAGYIADRAIWLRGSGQSQVVRSYLARPRTLTTRPADVEEWYEVLLTNAKAASADGQHQLAYDIARQIDNAVPPGTVVADLPYGERDDYTSLAWLAGTTAIDRLRRPADAVAMFSRYAGGSRTPTTRSKGLFWAGRAAEAAGDRASADRWYEQAAATGATFYGQLATERLGRPLRSPAPVNAVAAVDPVTRDAFFRSEVVRAVQWLGRTGDTADQGLFVRQIAADAKTASDHALATELAGVIRRPDLAVMVGRSALLNGHEDFTAAGYPTVAVPASQNANFTLVHAIARQESQFDRTAVSRVGARGLMQLMPATAREQSGKLGLGYNPASLTADPSYNIQLGSTYIQRMLDYYGGSYPLAIAAYNAGAGNVNKWIRANGDPRLPGVDTVAWIEAIPYLETRNYVQRVLENAVVYDLLHPQRSRSRGPNNLSWYLGRR